VTDAELRALLLDSLSLWGVTGRVEAHADGLAVNGAFVVQRAPIDMRPVRWLLHRPGRSPRVAPSIGALLTALRNALTAEG
jgi:hypothetical protein